MKFTLFLTLISFGFSATANATAKKTRNYFWPPVLSMVLPGFDQWKTHEYESAAVYSGLGVAGIGTSIALYERGNNFDLTSKRDRDRFFLLGSQMYQVAGSLSLYQSFRSIAREREDFSFLSTQETMKDVTTAPFRMDFMLRPTTFIPMIVVGALAAIDGRDANTKTVSPSGSDLFFATSFSYGAGVGEEAVFRGWLMPVSQRWFDNRFWSNTFQASLFAAAHLGSVRIPWPQFLMGWYLGILSQQKEWTIAEGIFIHTWWDIVAFLSEYCFRPRSEPQAVKFPPFVIHF